MEFKEIAIVLDRPENVDIRRISAQVSIIPASLMQRDYRQRGWIKIDKNFEPNKFIKEEKSLKKLQGLCSMILCIGLQLNVNRKLIKISN